MKPATQHALRLFGFRDTLVWNGVLSAVMIGLCAAFRPTWPAAAIYAALLIGGFFRSLQFTAYNTLAYGDVPRSRMSSATSLYVTCQQLAATIGISAGRGVAGDLDGAVRARDAAADRFQPRVPGGGAVHAGRRADRAVDAARCRRRSDRTAIGAGTARARGG